MLLLNSMKFYYKYKRSEISGNLASFNLHTEGLSDDYNTRQRDDIMTNIVCMDLAENVYGIICRKRSILFQINF